MKNPGLWKVTEWDGKEWRINDRVGMRPVNGPNAGIEKGGTIVEFVSAGIASVKWDNKPGPYKMEFLSHLYRI